MSFVYAGPRQPLVPLHTHRQAEGRIARAVSQVDRPIISMSMIIEPGRPRLRDLNATQVETRPKRADTPGRAVVICHFDNNIHPVLNLMALGRPDTRTDASFSIQLIIMWLWRLVVSQRVWCQSREEHYKQVSTAMPHQVHVGQNKQFWVEVNEQSTVLVVSCTTPKRRKTLALMVHQWLEFFYCYIILDSWVDPLWTNSTILRLLYSHMTQNCSLSTGCQPVSLRNKYWATGNQ